MIRALHRWPGLLALALLTVLALSGAALSVFPAAERLTAPQAEAGLTVADLASRIQAVYPGVEQIRRAPSGRVTAYWFDGGTPGAAVIDPATGQGIASADPNQVERWLTNLHRSLFLGDGGRIAMAAGAAAMLVLSFSGALLVARRAGGWRRWFAPLRGRLSGRLHVEIARLAVLGLALSSATALWMTASTFDLLPDGVGRSGLPDGGERRDRRRDRCHGPARHHARGRAARAELSLSGRPDRRLHAEDGPGHRLSRPGNRRAARLGRPDGMGARLGDDLHAAYRPGRRARSGSCSG